MVADPTSGAELLKATLDLAKPVVECGLLDGPGKKRRGEARRDPPDGSGREVGRVAPPRRRVAPARPLSSSSRPRLRGRDSPDAYRFPTGDQPGPRDSIHNLVQGELKAGTPNGVRAFVWARFGPAPKSRCWPPTICHNELPQGGGQTHVEQAALILVRRHLNLVRRAYLGRLIGPTDT